MVGNRALFIRVMGLLEAGCLFFLRRDETTGKADGTDGKSDGTEYSYDDEEGG